MNATTNTAYHQIPCAAIHAGVEFLLAIPHRENRFPIRVTTAEFPEIRWISSDSVEEGVVFSGQEAHIDHGRALKELLNGELLVSSVDDLSDPDGSPAEHYLVGLEPIEGFGSRQDGAV